MNPRRSGHQVYCTVAPSSWAIRSTILFSKPSPRLLENGRLLGSLQTRTSRASTDVAPALISKARVRALRQAKDIERPPFGRSFLQIGHGIDEAKSSGAVTRIEIARYDRARPASDTGKNGYILMTVRTLIGDRLSDNSGLGLELPQQLTAFGIDGFEPALHRPVE